MKNTFIILCFLVGFVFCCPAYADRFAPLKPYEVPSDDRSYKLEVVPYSYDNEREKGKARISSEKDGSYVLVHEVELAEQSPYSPEKAFISDHGAFVTIDPKGGSHSLVIYGTNGVVLRKYSLDDLLTKTEIASHVRHTVSTRRWLYGPDRAITEQEKKDREKWRKGLALWAKVITALLPNTTGNDPPKFNFSQDQNIFVLQTGWGKILKFDMKTGQALNEKALQIPVSQE